MSTSVDIFSRLCESDKETSVKSKNKSNAATDKSTIGEKRSQNASSIIIPEEEYQEIITTESNEGGGEEVSKSAEPPVVVSKGHKRTRSITNRYNKSNQAPTVPLPVITEVIVDSEKEHLIIVPLDETAATTADLSIPSATEMIVDVTTAADIITEAVNTNDEMTVIKEKEDGDEIVETPPPPPVFSSSSSSNDVVNDDDIKILEKHGIRHDWNVHYAALLDHIAKLGHGNVRRAATYECDLIGLGKDGGDYHYVGKLGIWLSSQRQAKKCSKNLKLSSEREALLQALVDDGKLQWDTRDDNISWSKNYAALVKYGEAHGNCNVPNKVSYECDLTGMSDDGGDYMYKGKLGLWLDNQRRAKKGNGKGKLIGERAALLQVLVDEGKLLWEPGDKIPWDISYAALVEYCKQHGTCNIPVRDTYECTLTGMGENGTDHHYIGNLGTWFKNQRRAKNGTIKNKLTPEKELKLQLLVDEGKMRW